MSEPREDIFDTVSLKTETDRNRLKGFIEEAVMCKREIDKQNEAIKDIKTEAKEGMNVPPKLFGRLVKAIHKDTGHKERQEFDDFESIMEALYPDSTATDA